MICKGSGCEGVVCIEPQSGCKFVELDTNECADRTANCPSFSFCSNVTNGFECHANFGYECRGRQCANSATCRGNGCTFAPKTQSTQSAAVVRPLTGEMRQCPACWEFREDLGKCVTKKGADSCFRLDCQPDQMQFDFDPRLFAVQNARPGEIPFAKSYGLTYDESSGRWKTECAIGGCGMTCESRVIGGVEFIVFAIKVETASQTVNVGGLNVFLEKFGFV